MSILALYFCIILTTVVTVSAALGYPTSINWVPTAETVGSNTVLLEYDNYGYPRAMTSNSTTSFLSQVGIGPNFEFGLDKSEDSESSWTRFNAKYRLFTLKQSAEDDSVNKCALAVGVMDVWRDSKPTFYTVFSGAIGTFRMHAGWIRGSYTHGVMLGGDIDIGAHMWCGIDYIPGDENHLRLGVSHAIGKESYLTLTYGWPNNRSISTNQFGITISTYLNISQ